jgi:hypothetical protein
MASGPESKLIECLDTSLAPHSFAHVKLTKQVNGIPRSELWRRKSWATNRAVALLRLPEGENSPGKYAQQIKMLLGQIAGYVILLNPLGLQIVMTTNETTEPGLRLGDFVDRVNNQRVVLQSIFLVNLLERTHISSRSWGQYFSARFQNAIEEAILIFLKDVKAA